MSEKTENFTALTTDDEKDDYISSVDETSLTDDEFQLINKKSSCNLSQTSLNNSIHLIKTKENEISNENLQCLNENCLFFF